MGKNEASSSRRSDSGAMLVLIELSAEIKTQSEPSPLSGGGSLAQKAATALDEQSAPRKVCWWWPTQMLHACGGRPSQFVPARAWRQREPERSANAVAVVFGGCNVCLFAPQVGRGSLNDYFNQVHMLMSLEYHQFASNSSHSSRPEASVRAIQALAQSLLHCLQKLDAFLGTSPDFLLGRWLASARASATSAAEADLFEFGARNQLIMWGPTPEVGPNPDYAYKHWSRLVGHYYHRRWAIYLDILVNQSVIPGKPLPAVGFISAQLDAFAQSFCQGIWNNDTQPMPRGRVVR